MAVRQNLAIQFEEDPLHALGRAQVAFQPIVSTTSLAAHGFEALARLDAGSAFASVHELLDAAEGNGQLRLAERTLLTTSLTQFSRFNGAAASRLFCNLDNRVFDNAQMNPAYIVHLARRLGLEPANLCIELSERQPPQSVEGFRRLVDLFLRFNVRIAIDDFGQGYSGLDMLMQVNPHYIKIDKAFITDLGDNSRKQAIVNKVAGLAHSLGLVVIAEGVETESEFRMARDLGCDLAQGFLIARPTLDLRDLRMDYSNQARFPSSSPAIAEPISELMETVEPLTLSDCLRDAIERFKSRSVKGMLPVVDEHGYVHGAIYESDIGSYLFGDFGSALLANKGMDQSVNRVMRRCPVSEASVSPEALVESYVVSAGNEGIVLTAEGRYVGFLGNNAILRLAAARDVAQARDQNPLTCLPGNKSIRRNIDDALVNPLDRAFVFFDFDNFKAFNDKYGFAAGDRALLVFTDILLKLRYRYEVFVGHIGGDDFFVSVAAAPDACEALVKAVCDNFQTDVASLYSPEDRAAGGIYGQDRFGEERFFPLLRASATILQLPDRRSELAFADIVSLMSAGKSAAKSLATGIIRVGFDGDGRHQGFVALQPQ